MADESVEVPFRFSGDCSVGQQILGGTKNPVAAFAISLFLCGVTLPPAMNVAASIDLSRADDLVFSGSDYFALLFGFVISCIVVAVWMVDGRCISWLLRRGLKEAAFSCAWLSLRGVRIALGLALVFTVLAAPAFFVCFCNNPGFRIVLNAALVVAPLLLVAKSNSVPAEHRFCPQSDLSPKGLSGGILIFFFDIFCCGATCVCSGHSGKRFQPPWVFLLVVVCCGDNFPLDMSSAGPRWHIENVPTAPFSASALTARVGI